MDALRETKKSADGEGAVRKALVRFAFELVVGFAVLYLLAPINF